MFIQRKFFYRLHSGNVHKHVQSCTYMCMYFCNVLPAWACTTNCWHHQWFLEDPGSRRLPSIARCSVHRWNKCQGSIGHHTTVCLCTVFLHNVNMHLRSLISWAAISSKEAALRDIDIAICVVVTVIEVFLSLFLIFCARYIHNMVNVRTFLHFYTTCTNTRNPSVAYLYVLQWW